MQEKHVRVVASTQKLIGKHGGVFLLSTFKERRNKSQDTMHRVGDGMVWETH